MGGKESWIGKELSIGRKNGTLLAFSIDANLHLHHDESFWAEYIGAKFTALQSINLGEAIDDDAEGDTGALAAKLDAIAAAVFDKLTARQTSGQIFNMRTLDAKNAELVLDRLDRETAAMKVGRTASRAHLLVAEPDAMAERFINRLLRFELRNRLIHLDAESDEIWKDYSITWPTAEQSADATAFDILIQIAGALAPYRDLHDLTNITIAQDFINDFIAAIGQQNSFVHGSLFWTTVTIVNHKHVSAQMEKLDKVFEVAAGVVHELFRFVVILRPPPQPKFAFLARAKQLEWPAKLALTKLELGRVSCQEAKTGGWANYAKDVFDYSSIDLSVKLEACIRARYPGQHEPWLSMKELRDVVAKAIGDWPLRKRDRSDQVSGQSASSHAVAG